MAKEQWLFDRFLFGLTTGEWEGGLRLPLPHPEALYFSAASSGGGSSVWVSSGLLVWSISDLGGGGGMQYNHLVFQARRHFCPVSLGGYCGL